MNAAGQIKGRESGLGCTCATGLGLPQQRAGSAAGPAAGPEVPAFAALRHFAPRGAAGRSIEEREGQPIAAELKVWS